MLRLKHYKFQLVADHQLTECQKDFWIASKSNAGAEEKEPLPVCSGKDGNYPRRECDEDGICFCRDPISGDILPGEGKDINCEGKLVFILNEMKNVYFVGLFYYCNE